MSNLAALKKGDRYNPPVRHTAPGLFVPLAAASCLDVAPAGEPALESRLKLLHERLISSWTAGQGVAPNLVELFCVGTLRQPRGPVSHRRFDETLSGQQRIFETQAMAAGA